MSGEDCPHCGSRLPPARDAFCNACYEPLDEPPSVARTTEEQRAFLAKKDGEAKRFWHKLFLIWKILHLGRLGS